MTTEPTHAPRFASRSVMSHVTHTAYPTYSTGTHQ
jgi:hypothetical protein